MMITFLICVGIVYLMFQYIKFIDDVGSNNITTKSQFILYIIPFGSLVLVFKYFKDKYSELD